MKRKGLYITIFAVLAAVVFLSFCGIKFLGSARHGEALLKDIIQKYDNTPALGELFNLEVACALPWGQDINGINFLPGDGLILQNAIRRQTTAFTLNGRTEKITLPVKGYRPGKIEPGTVSISIERPLHRSAVKKQTLTCKFKTVEIAPLKVENPDQLPLADEFSKATARPRKLWYWFAIAAIILAALLVWSIFKYRQKQIMQKAVLPPWEIARRNLDELRKTAEAGKQPLAWCVAKLSDVVREYLSVRFSWRIKQQTTEEFFAALKRKNSPLSAGQTFYLEEFMKQADLIKFANIRPDKEAFAQAADRAEELITQTALPENSDGKSEVTK